MKSYKDQGLDFARTFRWGLYAPRNTPQPVVDKLAQTLKTVLEQPDAVERLKAFGITAEFTPGSQLASVTATDIAAWKKVVKDAGISADN
ncbi:Tripartite tricarboxylate transporter family receptor [compost metagenome]